MRGWFHRFLWGDPPAPPAAVAPRAGGIFSTDVGSRRDDQDPVKWGAAIQERVFQRTHASFVKRSSAGVAVAAMDSAEDGDLSALKGAYAFNSSGLSDVQVSWYASQSFIGYQMCAMLAQNWLIDKACTMPARDATRNGYKITVNDGAAIKPEVLDYLRKLDKQFKIKKETRELIRNCRVFGIRIALFIIESDDPEFYEKPFNADGVTAGSYKGISQIDPYWITPELSSEAAANPASPHFYEPTYWRVNGKRYHRSHLVIVRTCEVPDVLKPTYYYGGVPLPQRIYERVYAAERTANEAPQLALTKRSTFLHVDLDAATANETKFKERMESWAYYRDNFGIKFLGLQESAEQFDTALADVDALIMTQFQLVAAIGEVPATKLLGTTPKGFQSTGEYEEANYHELLESLQEHDARPLIERHHVCAIRSYVVPKFQIPVFETTVVFNELDAETAAEKAKRTLDESTRDKNWSDTGAIDGLDVRQRLIGDPDSGYNGMGEVEPEGPRPASVVDPGAQKTAPNAPTSAEQTPPTSGASSAPAK